MHPPACHPTRSQYDFTKMIKSSWSFAQALKLDKLLVPKVRQWMGCTAPLPIQIAALCARLAYLWAYQWICALLLAVLAPLAKHLRSLLCTITVKTFKHNTLLKR